MKVAISIFPLKSAHKERGIGAYTKSLITALEQSDKVGVVNFLDLKEVKEADVIHYPWFDLFFHTVSLNKNFANVVTIYDVISFLFPNYYPLGIKAKINLFLQKAELKKCKFIVTDSQVSKRDIVKTLKVNPNKIIAVHLTPDSQFRILKDTQLLRIKMKYRINHRFILYVGDANWVNNLPFLIAGFNKLSNRREFNDLKLVLVGNVFLKKVKNIDHPKLESLKKFNGLIKEYKLEEKVIRPGFLPIEDLIGFYNLATVYIQPSLYEGFGLPILEAMVCGCPVICSSAGSLPEIGGDTPLYFGPKDLGKFVTLTAEVLDNESLRSKLSKLGLARAKF